MKYILIFFLFVNICFATPEFSIWSGNKCSTCHIAEQGGGARNNFGWNFARDASFFKTQELPFLEPLSTNQLFDTLISYGMDFRMQTVRSHKTENAVRRFFPMQASGYLTIKPFDFLLFDGQYNFGPKMFQGQQSWSASAILKFDENLPYIRLGYFQPAFGLKDCDMTDLDRRTATSDGTETLIAPDFAELGAEIVYSSLDWLTVQFGIFDASSLREVTALGDLKNAKSISSRIVIRPSVFGNLLSEFFIGGSNLTNELYVYNTAFIGVSPIEDWLLQLKYSYSNKAYTRRSDSYIATISYILTPGIILGLKGQYGESDLFFDIFNHNNKYLLITDIKQITLNAKVFLTPFLELIPEYRYMRTREYESTRWAFQIHLYY